MLRNYSSKSFNYSTTSFSLRHVSVLSHDFIFHFFFFIFRYFLRITNELNKVLILKILSCIKGYTHDKFLYLFQLFVPQTAGVSK